MIFLFSILFPVALAVVYVGTFSICLFVWLDTINIMSISVDVCMYVVEVLSTALPRFL